MSLTTLLIIIAIVAAFITAGLWFWKKRDINVLMTYLQGFTGVLFLISGWVKAMDPLGTAFKMEQYFAEFEATFEGTWFNFLAPLFPLLSEYAVSFSVFMIIFEIVLGLMLLMGHKSRLTSWLFLLLVGFFTLLTGFTFLTGYVPSGENFFAFSTWGPYDANNMRVTDCGCFGDFIKLEPRISFLKDVFLLIPAIFFVVRHKRMHTLFSSGIRNAVVGVAVIGLLLYCLSNYKWDIPHTDFRPFKEGVNIAEQKAAEEDAMANVSITAWKLRNKDDGRIVELSNAVYMKNFSSYPKEEWEVIEQVKSKPAIEPTKISDFEILDQDGYSVADDILTDDKPLLMIVCYTLYGTMREAEHQVADTTFVSIDSTLYDSTGMKIGDTLITTNEIQSIDQKTATRNVYTFRDKYVKRFTNDLNTLTAQADEAGMRVLGVVGGAAPDMIDAFSENAGITYPLYEADDILLKTIIRSNPGLVLMKNGKILGKWHYRKLPEFETLKTRAMQQ